MNRVIKYCMAGFGNVGVRFTRLLLEKSVELAAVYGCEMCLTAVCTRSSQSVFAKRQKIKSDDWGSRNFSLPNVRKDNTENGSESRPFELPPDACHRCQRCRPDRISPGRGCTVGISWRIKKVHSANMSCQRIIGSSCKTF